MHFGFGCFGPGAPHAKNMHFGFGCFGPGAPHAKNMHFGFGDSGVKICKKPRKNACFLHVSFILLGFWPPTCKKHAFFRGFLQILTPESPNPKCMFFACGAPGPKHPNPKCMFFACGAPGPKHPNPKCMFFSHQSSIINHLTID